MVHTLQHVRVSTVGDGEDVGWYLITPFALVDLDHTVGVDGVSLVGVDGNAEEARVGVDEFAVVARP